MASLAILAVYWKRMHIMFGWNRTETDWIFRSRMDKVCYTGIVVVYLLWVASFCTFLIEDNSPEIVRKIKRHRNRERETERQGSNETESLLVYRQGNPCLWNNVCRPHRPTYNTLLLLHLYAPIENWQVFRAHPHWNQDSVQRTLPQSSTSCPSYIDLLGDSYIRSG